MSLANWMGVLLSDQNPLLPSVSAMQIYLRFSWTIVQLVCVAWVMRRAFPSIDFRKETPFYLAAFGALLYLNLQSDGVSPAYWLGLAFNAPAFMSLLLCGLLWHRPDADTPPVDTQQVSAVSQRWSFALAAGGAVLGYVLLLDLLTLLPVQAYAWGFSPAAAVLLMALSLVPCVALNPLQRGNRWACFLPLSLLLFVVTRLPTGNVWDVVLDPLMWVALQVYLVIRVRRRAL